MLIYAGIDEAGYGPMLGPLCVAATVLEIRDHDCTAGPPDLWERLSPVICKKKRDAGSKRICIDDSKNLKGAKGGATHTLLHLERGVLAMLPGAPGCDRDGGEDTDSNSASNEPQSIAFDTDLYAALGIGPADQPWYAQPVELPIAQTADELRWRRSRVQRGLVHAGIACRSMGCDMIDAGPFNDRLDRLGNKAALNMHAALGHIDHIWSRWRDAHPRVVVDRHGGRTHYRDELQLAWPDASIRVLAETDAFSRYRLVRGGSAVSITFTKAAEDRHLPVALASMTAKYVRELMMERMNRYFCNRVRNLRPTAGYVQDGRRFVREITPLMRQLRLDRRQLIRQA